MISRADIRLNRRGIPLLVRRWEAPNAWAAMLIVHGLGEHSGRYERTGSLLAGAGVDVWAFDLVGFGGSGGDRGHADAWSTYLDDVADRLTPVFESGLASVLMGHSFGGLVAAGYAVSLNRQTDLLVLSSPALGYGGPKWQAVMAKVLDRTAPKLAIPNKFEGDKLSRDPAVGEAYQGDPLVVHKTTPRLGVLALQEMERVNSQLGHIRRPTLVIHGGADEIVPPAASVPVGRLPNVDRKVYPHLRHETLNEPEGPEVVGDIVAWLKQKAGKT